MSHHILPIFYILTAPTLIIIINENFLSQLFDIKDHIISQKY